MVLAPCTQNPPGIIIKLINNGIDVINQLVTMSTDVTHDAGIATVEVSVFLNSTADTVGLSVS